MVKKRGMSLEDKRAALLDIFHETKDVFVLKVRLYKTRKKFVWGCVDGREDIWLSYFP